MSFVYRYLSAADEVLYVGKVSGNLFEHLTRRLSQHRTADQWAPGHPDAKIEFAVLNSPADADALETMLIAKHHPRYNESKMNWGGCSFTEILDSIEWRPYPFGFHYEKTLQQRIQYIHTHRCDFCKSAIHRDADAYSHIEIKCPGLSYYMGFYLCESCAEEIKECADYIDDQLFPRKHGMTRLEFYREFGKNAVEV